MRLYQEYLTIPYKHLGVGMDGADCYGLLRLFYKRELGVALPVFSDDADEEWFSEYFLKLHAQYGFVKTDRGAFGNLIFFRTSATRIGHVGVILDDCYFIHMTTSGCGIDSYQKGAWGRRIDSIYELKETETV